MRKKKVVVLIDWYLPGYKAGGPIQSVANIIARLKDDFDFAVITSNCDLDGPYNTVQVNEWTTAPDGTRTIYLTREHSGIGNLKQLLLKEQADVLYMNSLFSFRFTLIPLYIRKIYLPSRKTVLAPRGMLGHGALNIKPFKKRMFLLASKLGGLFRNITWHASTELEAMEVKKHFGKSAKVITAGNLSAALPVEKHKVKNEGEATFVFLSRIASKKNLIPFIEALQQIQSGCEITFDIYGPVDDEAYWQLCQDAIRKSRPEVKITWKGPVENSRVSQILQQYHFSVLYTLHENFGHSIIEGLAAGCPVIISDQTPWRGLAAKNAGWDIAIDKPSDLIPVVEFCCKMNQQVYDKWSEGARTFAGSVTDNPETLEANRQLFN